MGRSSASHARLQSKQWTSAHGDESPYTLMSSAPPQCGQASGAGPSWGSTVLPFVAGPMRGTSLAPQGGTSCGVPARLGPAALRNQLRQPRRYAERRPVSFKLMQPFGCCHSQFQAVGEQVNGDTWHADEVYGIGPIFCESAVERFKFCEGDRVQVPEVRGDEVQATTG